MAEDNQKAAPQQGAGKRIESNEIERRAPGAPSTAYEFEDGDRGDNAMAHEQQMRDAVSGPSRDDVATEKPRALPG